MKNILATMVLSIIFASAADARICDKLAASTAKAYGATNKLTYIRTYPEGAARSYVSYRFGKGGRSCFISLISDIGDNWWGSNATCELVQVDCNWPAIQNNQQTF